MSLVDDVRKQIEDRLKELRPLIEEHDQLEAALERLTGGGSAPARKPRRATKRAPTAGKRKPGRPRGSGTRSVQALKLVAANPGITIPELAKQMKIQPNYLYRVLPELAKEGKIARNGKGWEPAG